MKLVDDWRQVAPRLWSVRLAILSAALSAGEFAIPYLAPYFPQGRFAAASFFVSLAAGLARIVAQPKLWSKDG